MDYPPIASIILVAVVPSMRDLEIVRILGWYRIPLRFAPKFIDVDYLAFYQPAVFGRDRQWMIEYVAEVKGNELTTRKELFRDEVDHPRANEEYYKIQLGSLKKLPAPIKAGKWKRLTFLYTLGELFNSAKRIDDLVLKSENRQLFWRTLRERSDQTHLYSLGEEPQFELDPIWLALLGDQGHLAETPASYLD